MKYNQEQKEKILKEFQNKIGEPFSPAKMRDNGAVELWRNLTGNTITIGGIINFLTRVKDPEYYKKQQAVYKENYRRAKTAGDGQNPLFKSIGDKRYVLVPSHGDAASFDTMDEVKQAIEACTSMNLALIKFKVLDVKNLTVKTTVKCEIE